MRACVLYSELCALRFCIFMCTFFVLLLHTYINADKPIPGSAVRRQTQITAHSFSFCLHTAVYIYARVTIVEEQDSKDGHKIDSIEYITTHTRTPFIVLRTLHLVPTHTPTPCSHILYLPKRRGERSINSVS